MPRFQRPSQDEREPDGALVDHTLDTHEDFIRFLNSVEGKVPAGKSIHAILDNYATHKHPKVLAWLARHPRWTLLGSFDGSFSGAGRQVALSSKNTRVEQAATV